MIGVETRIEIERPIGDVFDYVSDPRNFPAWNSAVQSVQPLGATTYLMERDLPGLGVTGTARGPSGTARPRNGQARSG